MFEWIGFDADDTLWENEIHYRRGRELFDELIAGYNVGKPVDAVVHAIEITNLDVYGFGAPGFILSLIEAAGELTRGDFSAQDTRTLIEHLKEMLTSEVRLLDGAEEVVAALAASYPMALITKGDLRHQKTKVERSGLAGFFQAVEIVSDKQSSTYAAILDRLGLSPDAFLMIGNSIPSDVLPVVEIGGWAIYVPNALTWSHEQVPGGTLEHPRMVEVRHLREVPEAVQLLASMHGA